MKRLLFAFFLFFLVDWIFFDGRLLVHRILDLLAAGADFLAGLLMPYLY